MAIVNGIGYDEWALAAAAARARRAGASCSTSASLLGLTRRRQPAPVVLAERTCTRVIDAIVADYDKLRPGDAALLRAAQAASSKRDLARYDAAAPRRSARATRACPVGYSESIFQPLGEDLGLKLLTPYSFAKAIAEGTDVTAADKQTVDGQAEAPRSRCGSSTART